MSQKPLKDFIIHNREDLEALDDTTTVVDAAGEVYQVQQYFNSHIKELYIEDLPAVNLTAIFEEV